MLMLVYGLPTLLLFAGLTALVLSTEAYRRQLGLGAEKPWLRRGRQLGWLLIMGGLLLACLSGNGMAALSAFMLGGLLIWIFALGLSRFN